LVEEPELDALLRVRDDADDERLLAERVLLARLPPDALLPDALLPDDRLVVERLLDELDRFDPPLDLPVLRRSAIWLLPRCRFGWTLPAMWD
jgi:hypothetical protein